MTADKPIKLATRVAYNTIIQILGKIISIVIGLLSVALMTRYLGQAGFGDYTTIITFVSFFAIIADLGMTLVTSQMISRPGADEKKIINGLFGLRLVSILVILGLAPLVAYFMPYGSAIKLGILIAGLSFIFPALNQIIIGLLQKHLRMDQAMIAETAGRILLISGVWLAIKTNTGLNGILWASVISAAGHFLVAYLLAGHFYWLRPDFDFKFWRSVLAHSWPLALTTILNLLYLKTDTLILSLARPANEVGLYGAAYRAIDVVTTLPFLFAGIILPILTRSWAEQKNDYFKLVLQKSLDLVSLIALPLIAGVLVLGRPVMALLAGPDFIESGSILKILIFAVGGIFIGCMFSHAVIAIDRQKEMIAPYIFVGISSLVLYGFTIPRWSYFGAATITVYSELMIAYLAARLIKKYTKFTINLQVFKKSLLASFLMAMAILIIPKELYSQWWKLLLVVGGGASFYLAALYALKGITKEDLKMFKRN